MHQFQCINTYKKLERMPTLFNSSHNSNGNFQKNYTLKPKLAGECWLKELYFTICRERSRTNKVVNMKIQQFKYSLAITYLRIFLCAVVEIRKLHKSPFSMLVKLSTVCVYLRINASRKTSSLAISNSGFETSVTYICPFIKSMCHCTFVVS